MRKPRLKCPGRLDTAYYHCVSRVVNRDYRLGDEEKEQFVEYMRLYESYCGVRVVTFCVMSNHFHILLAVPKRPAETMTDAELVQRVRESFGEGEGVCPFERKSLLPVPRLLPAPPYAQATFEMPWSL